MDSKSLNVLMIEDNPGDAYLIKFYLEESVIPQFKVAHAENLRTGKEFLVKEKFDIILLDLNLPDSFGIETIRAILDEFPGNLIIVLTGLTDEEVGLETVRYGAQDFLVKGRFDGKVLISSLTFAFERFRLNKQLDSFTQKASEDEGRFETVLRLSASCYSEVDAASFEVVFSKSASGFTVSPQELLHDPAVRKVVQDQIAASDEKSDMMSVPVIFQDTSYMLHCAKNNSGNLSVLITAQRSQQP